MNDLCMTYAIEISFDCIIYIPAFITIGSGIQMLVERNHRHTSSKEILSIQESRLKLCWRDGRISRKTQEFEDSDMHILFVRNKIKE
jgi:hypothetical protein